MKSLAAQLHKKSKCKDGLQSNFCLVLGLQWGNEGKGKLLNKLCTHYDYSCRFNGGRAIAEPTVLENGRRLRLLPYGIQHETDTKCILGNSMVVDPHVLLEDFADLESNGIDFDNKLFISNRLNLVTHMHH